MTDLSIYFQPVSTDYSFEETQLGNHIEAFQDSFPTIKGPGCALISVPEYRGAEQDQFATSSFRAAFYQLHPEANWDKPIYDLGEIKPGATIEDTYFALSNVVSELVKNHIIPIVIGGSQDLTMAMYQGYEKLEQLVNTCSIDRALDIGSADEPLHSKNFLSHMLLQRPCYLFNHAVVGLQQPYAAAAEHELFEKLFFDICRLGEFNQDFKLAEPHLRNADIISIDLQAIKANEIGTTHGAPNGFTSVQFCQIAKYAGISDKVTSIGFFNEQALSAVGASLLAEGIWYFIQGYFSRVGDFPFGSKADYTKFTVFLDEVSRELIFYKSNKSARWWMEVPYPPQSGTRYVRHHMIPCNKSDYDNAMKNELPDLWWKTYQKLG
ncbi:MAG: formimidoylglutamase [Crocinitomicaceae bacterium]|nr:formimidoylglutamase [Crocinitomicaceae bacterium]MDP4738529.1 formimidoylglutamase [Crocinitomicaceae bacterium]MDP4798681.1 formimidoylglutamase [Crocinitomicaceae bacterium]MDP4806357.1 formimidoylglutamase [Crocinitomicaceae bacterium]MDP4867290.1 formimidoylglutamase [Crocinitomicaceae bacterium]